MDLVETKSPVGRLSKLQTEDHKERAKRGVPVYILNTKEKVDRYVAERRQRGAPAWLFSVPLRTPVAQPARVYVIDA